MHWMRETGVRRALFKAPVVRLNELITSVHMPTLLISYNIIFINYQLNHVLSQNKCSIQI